MSQHWLYAADRPGGRRFDIGSETRKLNQNASTPPEAGVARLAVAICEAAGRNLHSARSTSADRRQAKWHTGTARVGCTGHAAGGQRHAATHADDLVQDRSAFTPKWTIRSEVRTRVSWESTGCASRHPLYCMTDVSGCPHAVVGGRAAMPGLVDGATRSRWCYVRRRSVSATAVRRTATPPQGRLGCVTYQCEGDSWPIIWAQPVSIDLKWP
jgi:hypothetical protein